MKMMAHNENVGALLKCWRPLEMLLPYGFEQNLKMLALYAKCINTTAG
jgi:hypothetical protein